MTAGVTSTAFSARFGAFAFGALRAFFLAFLDRVNGRILRLSGPYGQIPTSGRHASPMCFDSTKGIFANTALAAFRALLLLP